MELLNIKMPPFARTIWASAEAKREWEPKINRAASAYYRLELETVRAGMRSCTTRHINPDNISEKLINLARLGLVFLPLRKVGNYTGFAHYHPAVKEGKPWNWYGVIGANSKACLDFHEATERGDHNRIGELLGYPKCCRKFFSKVWPMNYIDPVWQTAENTKGSTVTDHRVELPDNCNLTWIGLRYIGIRLIPHLPCSFKCKETEKITVEWRSFAIPDMGVPSIIDLLSLPCEWNCSKGIALVTTPYFRISTNSIACYPAHIVKKP